ncbi:hypothetical protein ACHAWO_010110 [Cyclotella atomus]|uniref:Uncharacterized protein n=1 Tax=Cyclotella atomus TaxID=382360 RepID=A0ABD3NXQ8_9STRA
MAPNIFLLLLLSSLLLSPSSSFVPTTPTKLVKPLSATSSEENNSRLNQEEIVHPINHADYIKEPSNNDLPPPLVDNTVISPNQQSSSLINEYDDARSIEFNIDPLQAHQPSKRHMARLQLEARLKAIYTPVNSNEYWDLRDEILQLEEDLQVAKSHLGSTRYGNSNGKSSAGVKAIETMLRRCQAKDAEHVYRVTSRAAEVAERMGRWEEADRFAEESARARRMLPQFNLEGLWVGKYGKHGFEMINVTYSGDQLIAYKVTGDQNIPRGHISFVVDLSPPGSYSDMMEDEQDGSFGSYCVDLPRYPGRGQAAEPNYENPQYLEGQLVVIGPGDYFSFAWIPLEHQIFFGRPSPELTLKMLREGGSPSLTAGMGGPVPLLEDGNVRAMTDYLFRCMEITLDRIEDERCEGKAEGCGIWYGGDDEGICHFQ